MLYYVRDDLGMLWTFDKANQRVVLVADMADPESGYYCKCWSEAVIMLNEMGYITEEGI